MTIGAAWMFGGSWTEQGFNFVVFVILARLLAPEDFGLAMMAIVFAMFAEFLVRDTIADALIQKRDLDPGHLDAVFWLLLAFSVVIAISIFALGDGIAALYSEPKVAGYLRWVCPTVLFVALSGVPVALLRRRLEFRALAIRAVAGVVLGGLVGIVMAIQGYGAWSLIGQRLIQVLVNTLLAWFATDWRPRFRASREHFADIWGFGAKVVGLRASELVSVQTPTIVLGLTLGPAAVGYFTIAWRVTEVILVVLITPIRYVAQPAFASLQQTAESAGAMLQQISAVTIMIACASFAGLAAVGGPTVALVFGAGWEPAVPVLQILCLVGLYLAIIKLYEAYCLALGAVGGIMVTSSAEAILGIGMLAIAANYSLLTVAAAFAARYFLLAPFRFLLITRLTRVKLWALLKTFLPALGAGGVMAAAVLAWQNFLTDELSITALLLSAIVVGVIVYVAVIFVAIPTQLPTLIAFVKSLRASSREAATDDTP